MTTKKTPPPTIEETPECFIIMPIADPEGYEKGHFRKVYEDLISVACENAGYKPIRADDVKQTNLIHIDILKKLIESPMAICDLSNRNPNVLFELGLRQAFDKPTVLIQEHGTPVIFDISILRYTEYKKELKYREVLESQKSIKEAILATAKAKIEGTRLNSLINLLSLSTPASLKDVSGNSSNELLQIIMAEMNTLRSDFRRSNDETTNNRSFISMKTAYRPSPLTEIDEQYNRLLQLFQENAPRKEIDKNLRKIKLTVEEYVENSYRFKYIALAYEVLANADLAYKKFFNEIDYSIYKTPIS